MLSQWHAWYMEEGGGGFSTGKRNMNVWNEKITVLFTIKLKNQSRIKEMKWPIRKKQICNFPNHCRNPSPLPLPPLPMSSVLQKFSPPTLPPSYDIPRGALSQSRVISLPLLPLHYAYSPLHTLTLRNFSFPPLPPGKNFFCDRK